jgi:hypothetical protein
MGFAEITNTVLDFVRQHPHWAAFIVFGLSLGESLPFVSLVLPFWAMLVGIGTIIAVADPLISGPSSPPQRSVLRLATGSRIGSATTTTRRSNRCGR